jgi:hypothetical protein
MKVPDPKQLMLELERHGIIVGQNFVCPKVAAVSSFVGDLVGVGVATVSTKPPCPPALGQTSAM